MSHTPNATILLAELAGAWTRLKLADAALQAGPLQAFRLAVDGLEDLGDYAGPCPSRVVGATRTLARMWILSDAETRAGALWSAVDAAIDCAMGFCAGTQREPIGTVVSLVGRQKAARSDA
jgi:hypothetical protein